MRAPVTRPSGATIRVLSCNDLEVSEGELAEGWLGDPLGRHEERWFSRGAASSLVRDDAVEGHDPVSEDEQRSVGAMTLPPLPVSDKPPQPLIDLGPSMTERYLTASQHREPPTLGDASTLGSAHSGLQCPRRSRAAGSRTVRCPHLCTREAPAARGGRHRLRRQSRSVRQQDRRADPGHLCHAPGRTAHAVHLVRQSGQVRRGPRGPRVLRARVATVVEDRLDLCTDGDVR